MGALLVLLVSGCQAEELAPADVEEPVRLVPEVPSTKGPTTAPGVKGPSSPPPQSITETETVRFTLPEAETEFKN